MNGPTVSRYSCADLSPRIDDVAHIRITWPVYIQNNSPLNVLLGSSLGATHTDYTVYSQPNNINSVHSHTVSVDNLILIIHLPTHLTERITTSESKCRYVAFMWLTRISPPQQVLYYCRFVYSLQHFRTIIQWFINDTHDLLVLFCPDRYLQEGISKSLTRITCHCLYTL